MRSRGLRWRKIRRHIFITLPVTLAIGLGLWIARPGLASDFGIIPDGHPPGGPLPAGKVVQHRLHLPGPKFWRDGPPRLSDLQASAVQLWNDVKLQGPRLVADSAPTVAKLQVVAVHVKTKLVKEAYKFHTALYPRFVMLGYDWKFYEERLRHHCDEPQNANSKVCNRHAPVVMPGLAPEPDVWAMLVIGIAGLGWLLRRDRAHRAAFSLPPRSANSSR
jgi:hypothetical protein